MAWRRLRGELGRIRRELAGDRTPAFSQPRLVVSQPVLTRQPFGLLFQGQGRRCVAPQGGEPGGEARTARRVVIVVGRQRVDQGARTVRIALVERDLGVEPRAMEAILPGYLYRFRRAGEFRAGAAA